MATIQSLKPAHRQLLVVLLVAAIVPAGLAAWLAWRLLDQDRIIANEQLRDIRERRSDEVVHKLSSVLATLEASLNSAAWQHPAAGRTAGIRGATATLARGSGRGLFQR
ncbi:MAG: hypothetical protein IT165_00630 [Bryobacterales bacterium]|nr:hypothetical protein [Bryobacterales bacterium]